jgi:hypothetical protein
VLALITATYADFSPMLACEKLAERHGIDLGVEMTQRLMIAAGLWQDCRQKRKAVHQPRYQRNLSG